MKRTSSFRTTVLFWLGTVVGALAVGVGPARADFTFGEPVNLGPTANTSYGDCPSCISTDGLELYIVSNRPGSLGDYDLWVMTRTAREDEWEQPVHLGPGVNSSVREWDACLSDDGLELYFDALRRTGGFGNWDIWVSRRQTRNGPWGNAVNLGLPFNSSSWDDSPSLSPNDLEFYFCSSRPGGQGYDDLWVAERATKIDPWGEPVNLGPIVNSSAPDCAVKISSDSLLLFFSGDTFSPYRSGGFGLSDIWMTRRVMRDNVWSEPINLGPLVNSSSQEYGPVISQEGDTLYFGSNRPGGLGDDDIYQAPIIPIVDFNGDGKVDGFEVKAMADYWGANDFICDIGPMPWGDGIVDVEDLKVLAKYIGQPVDDPTLVGHWAMDETEGIVAQDLAGGNNGTVLGLPQWQPQGGRIDGALELNGMTFITAKPALSPADGPFSVLAWIKGGAPGQSIVSQGGSANWLMADAATGALMTELKSDGRTGTALCSEAVITNGNWHRIAFSWDNVCRRLYVDGVLVAEDAQDNLAASSGSGNVILGAARNMAPGTFWTGLIDDVRIYNRAVKH